MRGQGRGALNESHTIEILMLARSCKQTGGTCSPNYFVRPDGRLQPLFWLFTVLVNLYKVQLGNEWASGLSVDLLFSLAHGVKSFTH